ncbi:MAG: MFS transporter [Patescibacteria group bacterium]
MKPKIKTNRLFRVLVSSYALSTFSEGIILPIYAVFVQQIGGDILEASGAIAIFLVVSGVTTIFIHRTRWSQTHRMQLLVYGWLLWVVGVAFYFFISNTLTLFVAQVIVALGNAIANPAFDAELDDHTDKKIKSYEWGIFEALQDIFAGVAAIVGGVVAATFGFKALISFMVVFATISFLGILYYVRVKKRLA